jgi:hypothetical protein
MATPGSQYIFFAPGQAVNIVVTPDGNNLPLGVAGKFNLELVTSPPADPSSFSIAYTRGYQSAALLTGGTGQTVQLLSGNYGISDTGGGNAITLLSNGAQTVIGAKGDTVTGGTGNDLLNAVAGSQLVLAGTGDTTIWGGAGDTIIGSTGTVYIDGTAGGQSISGGNGSSIIYGGPGDTITGTGGSGASTIFGAQNDTITAGFGADLINATAGKQSITGGGGSVTVWGGQGDTVVAGSGDAYIDGTSGNMLIAAGRGGSDTIIGAISASAGTPVDTLTGGAAAVQVQGLGNGDIVNFAAQTGNATINATAGNNAVTLGAGSITVFGGAGDTIQMGAGNQYVDGTQGGTRITVGSKGGFDIVIGSLARVAGAGVDTLIGGAAQVQVQGLGSGDIVDFAGQSNNATVNATAGAIAVTLGSGNATVYGGINDAIAMGSGSQYVDGTQGGANIAVGAAGGFDIIIGSIARSSGAGVDTIFGGAAQAQIQALGKGDIVNFASQSGNVSINGTAGDNAITLGSGAASVYAGAGDTVTLGSVSQYVDARAGGATASGGSGALIKLGSGGTDDIIGSTVVGAPGISITGGAANLNYNPGNGNDLIDLTGGTGSAVINGFGADTGPINDTITAGNGGTSVWGGQGDRIGVGYGASGTDLFTHASTIAGASMGFGSNDSVVAANYGGGPGAVSVNSGLAGASTARVTVTGFAETAGVATDYIFYRNASAAANTAVVATSSEVTVSGVASTQMTLPDGTVMTLVGVPTADFNTSFFKP